jgi:hypothetical protein
MEAVAKGGREFDGLTLAVEGDGLSDIVDDHLAGVTSGHMAFEFLADRGVDGAIHELVEVSQEFFAFHIRSIFVLSHDRPEGYRPRRAGAPDLGRGGGSHSSVGEWPRLRDAAQCIHRWSVYWADRAACGLGQRRREEEDEEER